MTQTTIETYSIKTLATNLSLFTRIFYILLSMVCVHLLTTPINCIEPQTHTSDAIFLTTYATFM